MNDPASFIVLGTGGNFTTQVLTELTDRGVIPRAYIQWQQKKEEQSNGFGVPIEVNKEPSLLHSRLAKFGINQQFKSNNLPSQIAQFAVDFMLVACWPVLITPEAIRAATFSSLNLHPSLLPKYRGIDPIGEQFSAGDYEFGVTLHLLSDQYDTGEIVLQQQVSDRTGLNRVELETECARVGADLFIKALEMKAAAVWHVRPQT